MRLSGKKAEGALDASIGFDEWASLSEARGKVYGFLASLYCERPEELFVSGLLQDETRSYLRDLSANESLSETMREGLRLMEFYIEESADKPFDELEKEIGVERTRLLRGVKPGYGPPPPFESVYGSPEWDDVETYCIAAIVQLYSEAGLVLSSQTQEQADYIGVELDFLHHLCLKESEAWKEGCREGACSFMEMSASFLLEHAGKWIPKFCETMRTEAHHDLYRGVAFLTQGFIESELEQLDLYRDFARA